MGTYEPLREKYGARFGLVVFYGEKPARNSIVTLLKISFHAFANGFNREVAGT